MGEVQRCVRMDSCCMQEERWRGQVARFLGMQGRRYRLCRPENSDGRGGVEGRRRSDRVMTIVMLLEEVLRSICVYGPQSG